jgi:uncharacterized membrane protein YhaH (DUF805 family)
MSYPNAGSGPYPSPEQSGWNAPPAPAYAPPAQMGMGEAVSSVLSKYATFSGRARRSEYWWFYLAYVLAYVVAAIIDALLGVMVLEVVIVLAVLIPSLAVTVRRLHDVGRSAWWLLIALIPLAGPIVLLVFSCEDSQAGPNRWGPSPKYV